MDCNLRAPPGLPGVVPDFPTQIEAEAFLRGLQGRETIRHVTYFGFSLPIPPKTRGNLLLTTYPKPWADHYFANKYQRTDPVLLSGHGSILPYDWNIIPQDTAPVRKFFGEANEFGVGERGISFPIRGALGEKALFSITSDLSFAEWQNFQREAAAHLLMLAYQFHNGIVRMLDPEQNKPPHLGPREREVLAWAAKGKTIWDTASILGLQENTVSFYLKSAISKMRAVNKTHAVAEAVRLQLLP